MSKSNETAAKKCRRDPAKETFWRDCFRRFESSGLTVAAFCAGEGIKQTSFYYWRGEIRRRDAEATEVFVELVPTVEPAEAVETPAVAASAVLPRPAESAGSDAPTDGLAATDRGAVGEAMAAEQAAEQAAEPEAALELLLGGGWRLLIRPGCGQELLRRAVSALVPLRGVADARGTGPPVTGPPVLVPPGRRPAAFAAAEGEPC